MKTRFLYLMAVLFAGAFAQLATAQAGCTAAPYPGSSAAADAYGYTWASDSAGGDAYNWVDIEQPGNVVAGLSDDNFVGPINMQGVTFPYYWNNYTELFVGSNGYVMFGAIGHNVASGATGFPVFPSPGPATTANEFIGVYTADLTLLAANGDTIPGAKVYAAKVDSYFVVTWKSVPYWSSDADAGAGEYKGSNTFQVLLFPSGRFKLQHQNHTTNLHSAYVGEVFASRGFENITGNVGMCLPSSVFPGSNTAITVTRPSASPFQFTDASVDWVLTATANGQATMVGQTIDSVIVRIRNTGTVAITSPIAVQIRAQKYENGTTTLIGSYTQLDTIPGVPLNGFVDVSFPLPVPTDIAADLRLQGRILGVPSYGDQFTGNNDRVVEFAIVDTSNDKIYVGFDRFLFNDKYGVTMLDFDLGSDDLAVGIPVGMFIPAPLGLANPQVDVIDVGLVYYDNDDDNNTVPDYDYYGYTLDVYEDLGGFPGASPMMSFVRTVPDVELPPFMPPLVGTQLIAQPFADTIQLPQPIVLPAGRGIFLRYTYPEVPANDTVRNGLMGDRDGNSPASLNSYEITAGVWAPYREREVCDFALRAGFGKTGIVSLGEQQTLALNIGQNYPNPANGMTTIPFELRQTGEVSVNIRSLMGQTLYSESLGVLTSGPQRTEVDTRNFPAGIYLYTVTVNGSSTTRRMVVSQ
jgi:hypothetical protein